VDHLVPVTAIRDQPLGRLEHFGRIAIDDLGRDDLVDRELQPRIHHPPVHDPLIIPALDRVVERGWARRIRAERSSGSVGSSRLTSRS